MVGNIGLQGSDVLLIGLWWKKGVCDERESRWKGSERGEWGRRWILYGMAGGEFYGGGFLDYAAYFNGNGYGYLFVIFLV